MLLPINVLYINSYYVTLFICRVHDIYSFNLDFTLLRTLKL